MHVSVCVYVLFNFYSQNIFFELLNLFFSIIISSEYILLQIFFYFEIFFVIWLYPESTCMCLNAKILLANICFLLEINKRKPAAKKFREKKITKTTLYVMFMCCWCPQKSQLNVGRYWPVVSFLFIYCLQYKNVIKKSF